MAITKTVMNIDGATLAPTNWQPADKSDFVLVTPNAAPGDINREAIYQRVTDDDGVEIPNIVRVGYYPKPGVKPTSNRSVKATYHIKTSDSVLGTDVYDPLVITIAITGPGLSGGLDATAFIGALMNTASWLIPVTGGVISSDAISVLKFGVVNTLNTLND